MGHRGPSPGWSARRRGPCPDPRRRRARGVPGGPPRARARPGRARGPAPPSRPVGAPGRRGRPGRSRGAPARGRGCRSGLPPPCRARTTACGGGGGRPGRPPAGPGARDARRVAVGLGQVPAMPVAAEVGAVPGDGEGRGLRPGRGVRWGRASGPRAGFLRGAPKLARPLWGNCSVGWGPVPTARPAPRSAPTAPGRQDWGRGRGEARGPAAVLPPVAQGWMRWRPAEEVRACCASG